MITAEIFKKLSELKLQAAQMSGVLAIIGEMLLQQETATEILEQRRIKERDKKRNQRGRSRGQVENVPALSSGQNGDGHGDNIGDAAGDGKLNPSNGSNSFPHPSLISLTTPKENPLKGSKEKPQERGTAMPEDFEFPTEWQEWVTTNFQQATKAEIEQIFVEFRNYWCAVPGARGRKRNWYRTWQNRVMEKLNKNREQNYGKSGKGIQGAYTDPKTGRTRSIHTNFDKQDYYDGTEGFRVVGEPNKPGSTGQTGNGELL